MNNEFKKMQKLAGLIVENQDNESKVNNSYVIKDKEDDYYYIDKKKALEYLKQIDGVKAARTFINDDEGWGEFEQYLENVEEMTDEELEEAMEDEMNHYYGEHY